MKHLAFVVVWIYLVINTLARAVPSDNAIPAEIQLEKNIHPSAISNSTKEHSINSQHAILLESTTLDPEVTTIESTTPSMANTSTKAEPIESKPARIVDSSTSVPCSRQLCDTKSFLEVTIDPIGNKTGFISRALGLPVSFQCHLVTRGKVIDIPTRWRLPNGTEMATDRLHMHSVELRDSGEYTCLLDPNECCLVDVSQTVHLTVYELSETAGILLMLSVLVSIVVLVAVFIYSQKKKRYHSWLRHEILAAASSNSGESTPRSTLNRDLQNNSKKYLLNN